jgi:hypothetical protein
MLRLIQDMRSVERATTIYSAICVIVLMVCSSLTAQNLLIRFVPNWNLGYLPWLSGLVAVEALISQRQILRTSELTTSAGIYRLVELLFIFIVTRLASLPWQAGMDFGQILSSWKASLLENFFDAQFLLSLLVVIIIWGISAMFAQDLVDQEGDELALDAANLEGLVSDRAAAQRRLTGRVFAVGGVLVFINGLLRQEIIHIFGESAAPKQDAWHVVAYFVAGLILLSLSQLANRRLAWAWEQIPVKEDIASRWILTSVIFLMVVVLVAFALPTGYTIGFLPTLSYILGVILYLLYGLVLLILAPIFYIFGWLMSLFRIQISNPTSEMIQPPELIAPESLTPTSAPDWLELLKSILFWVVLLGVVGYSVYIYFNQNKALVTKLRQVRGFRWLSKAWEWLVSRFRVGVVHGHGMVLDGLRRWRDSLRHRPMAEPGGYLSLRRLNPRQKVVFYYLALLRRMDEVKLPRAGWQTPGEYENYLRRQLPEVEEELSDITEIFCEARYSQHSVAEGQIKVVRAAWEQVRKFLRSRIQG